MASYYHVDRVGTRLKQGQILSLNYTGVGTRYQTNRAAFFSCLFPEGLSYHGWNYLLNDNRPKPDADLLGLIEMMAELTRRSFYPERPSRLQSVFCWRTIEDARRFVNEFPVTTSDGTASHRGMIWRVRSEGQAFVADIRCLALGTCWIESLLYLNRYWQQQASESPLWEVLVRPPVLVETMVEAVGGMDDV
jgi:hypothetical protein